LFNTILQRWKQFLIGAIIIDLVVTGLGIYLFLATDLFAAALPEPVTTPGPPPTYTATPWAGPPGGTSTPIPDLPPTVTATTVLAQSGFPHGFTPTPRPTPEPVYISLPRLLPYGRNLVDVPTVNQVLYPEPFFPPGTNNACGPVALYAGLLGLNLNVDYQRVRDIAVSYGFNTEGITTWGMVNTAATINHELGQPFVLEHGRQYNTEDLLANLRKGKVAVVLLSVRVGADGRYRVTSDVTNAIGHFLIVERINIKNKTVRFAGSTLGMEQVSLAEFVASWNSNSQNVVPPDDWRTYLKNEPANGWAMLLKPDR
jgi:hypothetical protein